MRLKSIAFLMVLTIFWVVFNEDTSFIQICFGVVVSGCALGISYKYLSTNQYLSHFRVRILWLLWFYIYLIYSIYVSGLDSMKRIITGKTQVGIIKYKSTLQHPLARTMLANAITLTPGTVTANCDCDTLSVLCLYCTENKLEQKAIQQLEKILDRAIYVTQKEKQDDV